MAVGAVVLPDARVCVAVAVVRCSSMLQLCVAVALVCCSGVLHLFSIHRTEGCVCFCLSCSGVLQHRVVVAVEFYSCCAWMRRAERCVRVVVAAVCCSSVLQLQ